MGLRDNIAAAKRAGHSDEDINNVLLDKFGPRVKEARRKFDDDAIRKNLKAGELPDLIINDLLGSTKGAEKATGATRTPLTAALQRLKKPMEVTKAIEKTGTSLGSNNAGQPPDMRAVDQFMQSPTEANRKAMNEALHEAAKVDPSIPLKAQSTTIETLSRHDLPRAFDVFQQMTEADQAAFLRELGQSEEGLQLRARLFQEFRKRRGTNGR